MESNQFFDDRYEVLQEQVARAGPKIAEVQRRGEVYVLLKVGYRNELSYT